jgi:hypothetical protein
MRIADIDSASSMSGPLPKKARNQKKALEVFVITPFLRIVFCSPCTFFSVTFFFFLFIAFRMFLCTGSSNPPRGICRKTKGRRGKEKDESHVHLLRRLKKSSHPLCFILFLFLFFIVFLTRYLGVS